MPAVDLRFGLTPVRLACQRLLLAQALHPRLVPHRCHRLIDAAVGTEDQEPVEAAREPAVVGGRDHGALEEIEAMLQRLGGLDVEIVGRLVEQQQGRAAQFQQQNLETCLLTPDNDSNLCSADLASS
jgi:hypothetical protein